MIIRLDWIGRAMNRELADSGIAVSENRYEWRYYQHLAGQYHFFDTSMTITSLDDGSEIEFNGKNLKIHKKTRSVYLYNRSYVDRLIERYPQQSNLIRGILRPIPIERAVEAKDCTVLWHDADKVEIQERSLILDLEDWMRGYMYRYLMESFAETDELFVAVIVAKMYAFLPVKILDLRELNIKTSKTHSFHIITYLASHQRLEEFVPYLTLGQMLFLYRNLLYIERHTGLQDTFDLLVENLLTARYLPLYDYTLRQKDMDIAAGELSPTPVFVKNQLNLQTGLTSRDLSEWDVDDVLYKESGLARDNPRFLNDYIAEAEFAGKHSSMSNLPTKVLEVSAIDPENIDPIKLIDTLINEWLYMAAAGMYETAIDIINPLNGDNIRLDTRELFILFAYAHAQGFHGVAMKDIPEFLAYGVMRKRWIPDSEYLAILEHDHFEGWDDELEFFAKTHYEIYDDIAIPEDFMRVCQTITARKRVRHQYVYQPHRWTERAGRRAMYDYNYVDYVCDIRSPTIRTYDDFFLYIALDREKMSMEAWQDMAMAALNAATDFSKLNLISLKEIQSAMVRLFRRLSSYTIQFIEEIIGGEVIATNSRGGIPGHVDGDEVSDANLQGHPVTILRAEQAIRDGSQIQINYPELLDHQLVEDLTYDVPHYVEASTDLSERLEVSVVRPATTVQDYREIVQ
jgi:hypothetical protein